MADIKITLTRKQCDLIALALDRLVNAGDLNPEDHSLSVELFTQFDALSDDELPTASPRKGIHLIYDRDSNIRPFFPK